MSKVSDNTRIVNSTLSFKIIRAGIYAIIAVISKLNTFYFYIKLLLTYLVFVQVV